MPVQASAAFWLEKTRQARDLAENLRDPVSKRALLQIAIRCEHMARLALLVETGAWPASN